MVKKDLQVASFADVNSFEPLAAKQSEPERLSQPLPDLGPGGDVFKAYHLDKIVEPDMDDEDASFDPTFDPVIDKADPDSDMFIDYSGAEPLDKIDVEPAAPAVLTEDMLVDRPGFTYNKFAEPCRGALKGTRPEDKTLALRKAKLGKRDRKSVV